MVEIGMNKRGQVTLFIILAIILVAVVLVFFLWIRPTYFSEGGSQLGFENCVADSVEQAIEELEKNAGFINPEFTYPYNGEDFIYLCYTPDYYVTCTVQVPFLKQNFEEQVKLKIKEQVSTCYENSLSELRSQGYEVSSGELEYDVLFEPGVARVEIDAPTTVGAQRFARFNIEVNSPVYEMVMISTTLLQYESSYGDTDTTSLMLLYPDYKITKMKRSDGTTIYVVENRDFGNKFQFASRSLAWPAGYDI